MKTIILIEDDAAIRDAFSIALDANRYHVIPFESGNPVLENQPETPDLFVIDKNISGVDGLEICRFIKNNEKYKATPVIMLSATPNIAHMARDASADGAIAKPFTLTELRTTIAKYTS